MELDLEREFRDFRKFTHLQGPTTNSLFCILVATATDHADIGYCQAMASVVAFLLIRYLEETSFRYFSLMWHQHDLGECTVLGLPCSEN